MKTKLRVISFFLCTVVVFSFAGCELEFKDDPCRCIKVTASDEVHLGVWVVDSRDSLIKDLTFIVTQPRTGDTLHFWHELVHDGYYVYVDDRYVPGMPEEGEWIETRAYGRDGKMRFEQAFYVDADACNCHVVKKFGPDTIRVK